MPGFLSFPSLAKHTINERFRRYLKIELDVTRRDQFLDFPSLTKFCGEDSEAARLIQESLELAVTSDFIPF